MMGLDFFQAYSITIALETILLFLILRERYPAGRIIRNSLVANTLTHPVVWFVFPLLGLAYSLQIGISEVFAFVAEAVVYFRFFGWQLRYALFISLVCNLVSFSAGMLLLFFL